MRKTSQVYIDVGSRIKWLRTKFDLTLSDLAEKMGISYQQVQKYEKGQTRVSTKRLFDLCEIFDVSIGYFLSEDPVGGDDAFSSSVEREIVNFIHSYEGVHLNEAFSKIENKQVRHSIVLLVQNLALDCNDS